MWTHRGVIALVVSAFLSGGCATGQRGSLSSLFVKPGTPAVDLGGPAAAPQDDSKKSEPRPGPRAEALGSTIENSDPRLAAALVMEKAVRTAETYLRVALEYKRLGILDASADHLQQALQVNPRFAPAHEELARVWRDWGLPDFGLGSAYRAIYFAPASASAQNTLGTILSALDRFDAARAAYRRALALEPDAGWALNNLCDLERRFGLAEDARAHCEESLRMDPTSSVAHNNLALILAGSGDLTGAQEHFLAAGDEASAAYNVGIMYLAKGNLAAAAVSFERAIRLRPDFTAAKERAHLARLRLLTGGN